MWERFVAGYERHDSQNTRDVLTVLRYTALFARFGFEDPVSEEAQYICRLIAQKADPLHDLGAFPGDRRTPS